MKKSKEQNIYFGNQDVQNALEKSVIIDQKHWLASSDMRSLLASLGADYDTVCKWLPDSGSIRDGCFVIYFCLEACLALVEKLNKQEPGKKAAILKLPYRHDRRALGYVSTANYEG